MRLKRNEVIFFFLFLREYLHSEILKSLWSLPSVHFAAVCIVLPLTNSGVRVHLFVNIYIYIYILYTYIICILYYALVYIYIILYEQTAQHHHYLSCPLFFAYFLTPAWPVDSRRLQERSFKHLLAAKRKYYLILLNSFSVSQTPYHTRWRK